MLITNSTENGSEKANSGSVVKKNSSLLSNPNIHNGDDRSPSNGPATNPTPLS